MGINSVAVVADLGESYGNYTIGDDAALLGLVTASNIACGFHAGDPRVMDATVRECVERGIELGAHPGYPDLVGFGRRLIEASEEEIRTDVLYQIGALDAFARVHGGTISHVAPTAVWAASPRRIPSTPAPLPTPWPPTTPPMW
uniref:LamB/YcsF family protein n=1 Tax=Arthrobacter sp. ERGS1:01 TaxID=1704044 RepID=UPI000A5BB883|nr:LamB/YcsF family protein [Arthrobacter sp. ERGS1:01]